MFGREKKPATEDRPVFEEPTEQPKAQGKGRPTPKRSDAEAANKRPLVPDNRKLAKQQSKERMRVDRARIQQGIEEGDERYLTARDKGPVRRYVRDYVDSRWNVGEFFIPAAVVFFVLTILVSNNTNAAFLVTVALYVIMIACIVDAVIMTRILKRRLIKKFGRDNLGKGISWYAVMRVFQIRPWRMPKPQVARGEKPS